EASSHASEKGLLMSCIKNQAATHWAPVMRLRKRLGVVFMLPIQKESPERTVKGYKRELLALGHIPANAMSSRF
ncbi:hypothetical protein HPB47_020589, partial [Ixodes persulcatus]